MTPHEQARYAGRPNPATRYATAKPWERTAATTKWNFPTDEDPTPNTEDRPSGSQHPALSPPLQGRSEHRPRLRAQSRQQQLPDPLRGVETLAEGSRPRLCAPAAEDAALTVGVMASPTSAAQRWRLQATRPDGSAVVTSRPYPSYEAADAALDFVGVLSVLAGDPAQAGRVITSTTPNDLVCDCRSLGAACLHFQIEDPDTRGRNRDGRGLYLGL